MNQDIVYEILKFLHLAPEENGGALLAKKVINMSRMFYYSTNLNRNIGKKWDVSKVQNTSAQFFNCKSLNKDIGRNWKPVSLVTAHAMFYDCKILNQYIAEYWFLASKDSRNSETIKDLSRMFYKNIGRYWRFNNSSDFYNCKNIDKNTGKNWNLNNMFLVEDED
jgi:hypothetical protein